MTRPTYTQPFALPTPDVTVERRDGVDLYRPAGDGPSPAVVFVHGGPVPPDLDPRPSRWPVFDGYASLVAARGAVGVMFDHRLYGPTEYPAAALDVERAAEVARADPGVDPERIALWFFSGGSPLLADWLRTPPPWLRCVAATYPILQLPPEFDDDGRFQPITAVAGATVPIVLTRVGLERPGIAAGVAAFLDAAGAAKVKVELVDVPEGHHGFDHMDYTDQSRGAVEAGVTAVLSTLE